MKKEDKYNLLEALHKLSNAQTIIIGEQARMLKRGDDKDDAYLERALVLQGEAKDFICKVIPRKKSFIRREEKCPVCKIPMARVRYLNGKVVYHCNRCNTDVQTDEKTEKKNGGNNA